MNLPNQLTIFRILLSPVIGILMYASFTWHFQAALLAYAVAAATDTLDGEIARRRNQVTDLGKLLDPLADKLLVITILSIMVGEGTLAAWVVVIILGREFLITGLRFIAAQQGVVIASTPWGKSKTLTQNLMIAILLLGRPYPPVGHVAFLFIGLAIITTILSGGDYLWRYRRFIL